RSSTRSSPSQGMRPTMVFRRVVLPEPLGPMIPRMRPGSTLRSMPSSATVVPNVLRRPLASMVAMASALLSGGRGVRGGLLAVRVGPATFEQLFRFKAESLDGGVDSGPFLFEKLLPFFLEQQLAGASVDEHSQASPRLDEVFVRELLVRLEDREGIEPILGGDATHRGQRFALLEHSLEDHRHHAVAKLAINRLSIIPLTARSWLPVCLVRDRLRHLAHFMSMRALTGLSPGR